MTCRRHTILHLDDEEALGRCLQEMLRDDGYDVHHEPSKTAGYEWVLQHRPDLIISDVHSPGMDGLQFLHWIKRNPVTRRVPFMFLTAFSDLRTAVVSRKLGVDEFITKPFELNDLLAAIGRVLATAWSPSIYPPGGAEGEADLELAPWNLIDGLCRSLSGAWSERICYVGNSGSWASFFVTESGKNLVACCVDRPHSFRKIDARRVLDHHRWMREIGARYGLLIGFFDPDDQTRNFARQLGIEIVGADGTRNVLRRAMSPVGSGRTSLLDHLQVSLPELDGGTAFTGFALRIEEELARFAGKRFKI